MGDSPTIEPLYSDAQVVQMLDPSGTRIKARSIRSERENGRLVGTRVAGKWCYAASDVAAFIRSAREETCHAPTPDRGLLSSATSAGPEQNSISAGPSAEKSSNGRRHTMPPILGALANSSKRGSATGAERHEAAPVIPIRSGLPTS